jgi:hypothetical protein
MILGLALAFVACSLTPSTPIDPKEDSARQRAIVDAIGEILAEDMDRRSAEEALLLELDDLYAPLSEEQRAFLEAIRQLEGADPSLGVAAGVDWVRIDGQRAPIEGGEASLGLQLLPLDVWQAFREMDRAMRRDLGRGLMIGSGYRSPANQLFIFVRYMPYYDYSPEKTRPHVSLPGASDHNHVERQGIDFVSEEGVDLRYSDPSAFRALEEHGWLIENAERFGFACDKPDGVSPWHWYFRGVTRPSSEERLEEGADTSS